MSNDIWWKQKTVASNYQSYTIDWNKIKISTQLSSSLSNAQIAFETQFNSQFNPTKDQLNFNHIEFRRLKDGEVIEGTDFTFSSAGGYVRIPQTWARITYTRYSAIHVFRKIKEIIVSEGQRNDIIKYLKKERAFNADSALKVSNEAVEIYKQLLKDGFIKCTEDDRFWVE